MRLIIQKFGGSSLYSRELRSLAAEHVLAAKSDGCDPIVVVSAMGRKGEPYATDTLLDLIQKENDEPSLRETDLLLSCGEQISSCILATHLAGAGHKAVALSGGQAGIITNGVYGQADIIRIKKERILKYISDGFIVVIAGFQGVSEQGEVNTLGRGGSDTTAVALAAALEAEMVEIYSDVDAVMTADPRLVPDARPIKNLGYHDVLQMVREGAKVIHPRAVEIALQYNVPLLLKRTGAKCGGTLVSYKKGNIEKIFIPKERAISGITHIDGLAQVRLLQNDAGNGQELEEILEKLDAGKVHIDLVSITPQGKMFTIPAKEAKKVSETLAAAGYQAEVKRGFAKVTVVGSGLRGTQGGVMARVITALKRAGADILQTADSNLSISCLIHETNLADSVKSLHLEFGLGNEAGY